MEFTRLEGAFGARVTGIDLSKPIEREALDRLIEAFFSEKLMVFPGQKLSMEAYEDFARQWGELRIETYNSMVPGHPAIMEVGNTGGVLETERYRNMAAFWHTDRAYAADCNAITMLYAIHVPAEGGETHFCDLVAAYKALDDDTRARIEGLHASHSTSGGDREDWEFQVRPMEPGQEGKRPIGRQPLVRRHDVTGKLGL